MSPGQTRATYTPTVSTSDVSEERRKAQRVAAVSLGAAVFLIIAKLAAGIASGSLALLSEAAHSSLDAVATLITLLAVRIASRPPDAEHPYGHGKAENISALLETFFLVILAIFIGKEAIERLVEGAAVVEATWYAFAVTILAIVVEASRSQALKKAGKRYRSPALEADALHFTADMLTSVVVLAGLALVRMGYPAADAWGAIIVALYVAVSAVRLGKRSVDVLMDRAPTGTIQRLEQVAAGVEGVEEVRRIRARHVGGTQQMDVVIAISRSVPLERAHEVTEKVERAFEDFQPGADVVVHVEPIADEAEITEKVAAIAAREPRVSQVHNIYASLHPDGIHLSLHAKFPGEMTLAEAHQISETLEASIAEELPGVARVDTHLEPLEPQEIAQDITEDREELTDQLRALANGQPEVHDCHEIQISRIGDQLTVLMHCEATPGLSVDQVHDSATRIEDEVHRRWPEVARVTVHFEPARIG